MGCIGVGAQGIHNLKAFLENRDCRITAICDVAQIHKRGGLKPAGEILDEAVGKGNYSSYVDFRDLLARDDIDTVMIAAPDYWHVLIALAAARAGKDMYCEKTLALSMKDRQVLRKTINQYGRIFQFGTQQRSESNFRFGCELVLNGRIGKLRKVTVGSPTSVTAPNYPPQPVPGWLTDYDLWLGPAPLAPYSRARFGYWSHISDYSLGWIAHWGIHHVDIALWGSQKENTGPVEIEGTGTYPPDGLTDTATDFDVTMKYADGLVFKFTDNKRNPQGVLFEGTKGRVFVKRGGVLDAHPKSLLTDKILPNETHLIKSPEHHRNFLDCVKSRQKNVSPIEVAVRSDTVCHISDIAMRLGRKLNWDPLAEQFTDDDQANRLLHRPIRPPWHL